MNADNEISSTASPATSLDGDEFNSAEAKIYFGPVTSPEKKVAAAVERERDLLFSSAHTSPLRRSPRLSTQFPGSYSIPNAKEANEENTEQQYLEAESRAMTPENDGIAQDEPSSVLASRIMRAQDNPSPPPQHSEVPSSSSKPLDIPAFDISGSRTPDPRFICTNYEEPFTPTFLDHTLPNALYPIPASPPQHADSAPDSVTEGVSEPPQPPLKSVDSFTPPLIIPASLTAPARSPSNPLDETSFLNVPTLSPIPVPAGAAHAIPAQYFTESLVLDEEESELPDAVEEQIVEDTLIVDPGKGQNNSANTPVLTTPDASEEKDAPVETQQTPLRRSSRPRRSIYESPFREAGQELALDSSDQVLAEATAQAKKRETSSPRRKIPLSIQNSEIPLASPSKERSSHETSSNSKRELQSLSPSSVTILGSLLPSSPPKETQGSGSEAEEFSTPVASGSSNAVLLPKTHLAPPIRFASPKKLSSNKYLLKPPDPDDPNRTPARRIPIQDAVARGQISPQKGAQILFGGHNTVGGSKPPALRIPPSDSPARRVMVADSLISPTKRLGSPVRSPVRSRSAEPQTMEPIRLKQRGSSAEPSRSALFSRPASADRLPYPIVAKVNVPTAVPEEPPDQETQSHPNSSAVPPQSMKSRLKQPTSRIPRIGLKPYAKPASTSKAQESKVHGKTINALRKVDWSKPSEAASTSKATSSIETGKSRRSAFLQSSLSSPTKASSFGNPSLLKRKRGVESASPTKLTPVVMLSTMRNHSSVSSGNSPIKKPGLAKLRMVVDKDAAQSLRKTQPVQDANSQDGVLSIAPELPTPDHVPSSPSSQTKHPSPTSSTECRTDGEKQSEEPVPGSSPPSSPIPESTIRRSTRSNRNTQSTAKVEHSRAPITRRKNINVFQDSGPFSNMTAVALRALTNSNTTKNQKYVAATLETEVVRKEGARPESPVMKVKTIMQKEKEEKSRDRKARAERRAMRGQPKSSKEFIGNESDLQSTDTDDENWDAPDSSPSVRRHARGPGDEEDYETPLHPAKGMKRLRLDDAVVAEMETPGKKRVKWDRGLYKEIYLDEVRPRRSHSRTTEENVKGCLAPTAKALVLDNLGNLPNVQSPLKDLVQENIVVKKFVYDSDLEPIVHTPTPAVVKSTRSKAKKSKS